MNSHPLPLGGWLLHRLNTPASRLASWRTTAGGVAASSRASSSTWGTWRHAGSHLRY